MIGITKLLCEDTNPGDAIRYGHAMADAKGRKSAPPIPKSAKERRPVVAWNVTRTCNLRCIHCYTDSESKEYEGENSVPKRVRT